MRLRVVLIVVVLAVVATSCSNTLGRTMPECDGASSTIVLAVQSVPGSAYVSCIESLRVGWDYEDLVAEQGQSSYSLDSDRMGSGFVKVSNLQSCELGRSELTESQSGVELWKDVVSTTSLDVVIVPEGPTEETSRRTLEIMRELADVEVRGRTIEVTPSIGDATTSQRIDAAVDSGAHVLVVGLRDVEEGTLGLVVAGTGTETTVDDLDEAIEAIEDTETEAMYTGTWHYVFDGGCVVYTFDARGILRQTKQLDPRPPQRRCQWFTFCRASDP